MRISQPRVPDSRFTVFGSRDKPRTIRAKRDTINFIPVMQDPLAISFELNASHSCTDPLRDPRHDPVPSGENPTTVKAPRPNIGAEEGIGQARWLSCKPESVGCRRGFWVKFDRPSEERGVPRTSSDPRSSSARERPPAMIPFGVSSCQIGLVPKKCQSNRRCNRLPTSKTRVLATIVFAPLLLFQHRAISSPVPLAQLPHEHVGY